MSWEGLIFYNFREKLGKLLQIYLIIKKLSIFRKFEVLDLYLKLIFYFPNEMQ